MQLVSAHTLIGAIVALVVILALAALGVPKLVALLLGAGFGWLAVQTVLRDLADRMERWLTTPR